MDFKPARLWQMHHLLENLALVLGATCLWNITVKMVGALCLNLIVYAFQNCPYL